MLLGATDDFGGFFHNTPNANLPLFSVNIVNRGPCVRESFHVQRTASLPAGMSQGSSLRHPEVDIIIEYGLSQVRQSMSGRVGHTSSNCLRMC